MLHIVQVVMWGAAKMPQLFLDEAKARAAYVESARKHWDQRYLAYCEHHGLDSDSFESAQAFVQTVDVSEKCGINYWTLDAQEAGLGEAEGSPAGEGMDEVREVAREVDAVKAGLTRLLDGLSSLSDRFARLGVAPGEEPAAEESEKAAPSPAAAPQEEAEVDAATCTTPEWKAFVGTIKRLGSGSSNDFYLLPRDDWRQDVYSNRTSLEYWDWVADRVRKLKERAEKANYSVVADPDSPGCYKFANPEGIASEERGNSEWEAWCAAGLDLEAKDRNSES